MDWRTKVELFEEIRREYEFGIGTIAGTKQIAFLQRARGDLAPPPSPSAAEDGFGGHPASAPVIWRWELLSDKLAKCARAYTASRSRRSRRTPQSAIPR